MKKILTSFMLTLMFVVGLVTTNVTTSAVTNTGVVEIHANGLNGIMDSIQTSDIEVMGDGTKQRITGLAKEIQEIVLVIVMAFLMCAGIWKGIAFAGAGDDSKKKGELKGQLLFLALGVSFLASYYAFLKFGFINLRLFQ